MAKIIPVPILQDNYVWLILTPKEVWAVDPGEHEPIVAALEQLQKPLSGILITHRHHDHIKGVMPLSRIYSDLSPGFRVYGPQHPSLPCVTHSVKEGDTLNLDDLTLHVLETPGHTTEHICYWNQEQAFLFCGDTLFAAGCGRIFDGTMEQLYQSLQRLSQLPSETLVFCTHEYTLSNLNFALAVEPRNIQIKERKAWCEKLRSENIPTLPSRISDELATNPFLRTHLPEVQNSVIAAINPTKKDSFSIFASLRIWKNHY